MAATKDVTMNFAQFDNRLKEKHPRLYPWLWFVGLYLAGMTSLALFAYGMRWLIKG